MIEILYDFTTIYPSVRYENGQYKWKYHRSNDNFVREKYLILKKSSKDNKIYGCNCNAEVRNNKIIFSSKLTFQSNLEGKLETIN